MLKNVLGRIQEMKGVIPFSGHCSDRQSWRRGGEASEAPPAPVKEGKSPWLDIKAKLSYRWDARRVIIQTICVSKTAELSA